MQEVLPTPLPLVRTSGSHGERKTDGSAVACEISVTTPPANMNTLTHWNPLRDIEEWQSRVLRALQPAAKTGNGESAALAEWTPVVDLSEDDQGYLVLAELPGIARDQVKIRVEDGRLVFAGRRVFEQSQHGRKHHRVERAYGAFRRSFLLPEDTDVEKIHADFKDGLLRIHLPKRESALPRRIEVKLDE